MVNCTRGREYRGMLVPGYLGPSGMGRGPKGEGEESEVIGSACSIGYQPLYPSSAYSWLEAV